MENRALVSETRVVLSAGGGKGWKSDNHDLPTHVGRTWRGDGGGNIVSKRRE